MRRLLADFVHNCIAHPLLFWTREARWAVRLHDRSAAIAYPDGS
jgi:hypothetical protein